MSRCILVDANMTETNLMAARPTDATLIGCTIIGTILIEAELTNTNIRVEGMNEAYTKYPKF